MFAAGTPIIGICAAGILIRLLAPHLGDKHSEPPVIAISPRRRARRPAARRPSRRQPAGAADRGRARRDGGADHGVRRDASRAASTSRRTASCSRTRQRAKAAMAARVARRAGRRGRRDRRGCARPATRSGEGDEPLIYHAKTLVAGVGCERGTDPAEVIALDHRDARIRQPLAARARRHRDHRPQGRRDRAA